MDDLEARRQLKAITRRSSNVRQITAQLYQWRHVFPEVWALWLEYLLLNILDNSTAVEPGDPAHIDEYAYLREILNDMHDRSPRG